MQGRGLGESLWATTACCDVCDFIGQEMISITRLMLAASSMNGSHEAGFEPEGFPAPLRVLHMCQAWNRRSSLADAGFLTLAMPRPRLCST